MSTSPFYRRVLGDLSANINHPSPASKQPQPPLAATFSKANCSPKPVSLAADALSTVDGCSTLRSFQAACQKNVSASHELAPSNQNLRDTSPTRQINCRKHADRLRMRLKLAYYKVKINKSNTSLSDLPIPAAASPLTSASSPAVSLTLPAQHMSFDLDTSSSTNKTSGLRSAKLYNAHADATASITALRLQSLPAVMSDAAIRIATGTQQRPKNSRRKMGTFVHVSGALDLRKNPIAENFLRNKATSSGRRKKGVKKSTKTKLASMPVTTTKDKRLSGRSSSITTDSINHKRNETIVTPARKRPSASNDRPLHAVPSLGAEHEATPGLFSSPFKNALPSSAIKGTPGQIGAARSLLELGGL